MQCALGCTLYPLAYQGDTSIFLARLYDAPGAVLLDSGYPASARGRYDILTAWPLETMRPSATESGIAFFSRVRAQLAALGSVELPQDLDLPFVGGVIGFCAYDFAWRLEHLPRQQPFAEEYAVADACFGLYAWALITDHLCGTTQLVFHPAAIEGFRAELIALFEEPAVLSAVPSFSLHSPFLAGTTAADYQAAFARISGYIQAGDCYQVNFAQCFQSTYSGHPLVAYLNLRKACPTPFAAYLALPQEAAILSFSPERFLQVRAGWVETRPIKGTHIRGADPQTDERFAQALLHNTKERAENLMIVDLLRNDLGRSCAVGSVAVPEFCQLESYPNVHHLVSSITGRLADGTDALDLLASCFPGGSITGAPKIRAMQIIEELETARRGIYCGSILYLDVRGAMDSSITIRTLLAQDQRISCWAGGGIVADSSVAAEYQESINKVQLLLHTLEHMHFLKD